MSVRKWLVVLAVVAVLTLPGMGRAEHIAFDFDSGPGPNFAVSNDGGLWTVDTDGPDLRISKPADDGTFRPNGFVAGGITSNFTMAGDFTVTVDFALHDFPGASGIYGLNESLLIARSSSNEFFEVLRFRAGDGNKIEVFAAPPGTALGVMDSTITNGRYRIQRSGSTVTGSFAPTGSSSFTSLATVAGFPDPMLVQLVGVQGRNVPTAGRSTTALDISFDNLVVEADHIEGYVPTPSTFVGLISMGLMGALGYVWRRRRRR